MIVNHIENIQRKSRYNIEVLNLYNSKFLKKLLCFGINKFKKLINLNLNINKKDISSYDGYIIHNTISYDINNVIAINNKFSPTLENFEGFKILMKQDEMLRTNLTLNLLNQWKFNLYLTCIPKDQWGIHFSSKVSSSLHVMQVLTGYVEDRMRDFDFSQDNYRPVDIFYRGMLLPYYFGKLSYEKYFIGEEFKKICKKYNLISDISSNIGDRLYGKDWFNALANSKAVLAVESGASIFDWDGSLQKQVETYMKNNPKASFEEVWGKMLKDFDGKINYGQVSPRHFEAASTKTLQIMFEGNYSNIFIKDVHYLSLKKDFSNLEEVLAKFKDQDLRKKITDRAFNDIILNEKYSYDVFIKELDEKIANI
ncbi:MAG: hypothetical protein RCG15_04475 [Candidatus Rickettsia vulgarisii]